MKLRETAYVLRIHASKKKQGYEEYYAELLLFLPYRNEENDLPTDENGCQELFLFNFELLRQNRLKIFPYSNEIEAMRILLETTSDTKPEHIYDTLDGEGHQDTLILKKQCYQLMTLNYLKNWEEMRVLISLTQILQNSSLFH